MFGHFKRTKVSQQKNIVYIGSHHYVTIYFLYLFRLRMIYDDFHRTIQLADDSQDLKWWTQNYGTGMAMNWPTFEVKITEFSMKTWSKTFFKTRKRLCA